VAIRADIPATEAQLEVCTLTENRIGDLRLGWNARVQPEEIRRLLAVYPGRSVWAPSSLEYAVIGSWRHRKEIGQLIELSAVRHPKSIIDAAVERCIEAGDRLLVSVELDEIRRPVFYDRIGFELLEEIVTYEWTGRAAPVITDPPVRFESVDLTEPRWRTILLDIDHAAFPWLWWNSDLEFQAYALIPGVEVQVGFVDRQPVAYLGMTYFPGWGHLDRIAVDPAYQGIGVGQAGLAFAMVRLLRRGARRIGLSTQSNNLRSRRLYERFGFRRASSNDYRLYGRLIGDPDRG
jgi:ribosomal protein S18 acetylase RimI-like enzyme